MKSNAEYVLGFYPLHVQSLETHGKVTKVTADEGVFSLKETQLNNEQAERFLQTLRFFEKQETWTVAPVVRTVYGDWYVIYNNSLFYLLSWGEDCSRQHPEGVFFKTLALFHRFTGRNEKMREENWIESGERYRKYREQQLLKLEAYADHIEKKHYYSPFELGFLMHFPFIYQLHKDSIYWYEKWEDEAAPKEKITTVRCHGRPSPDHIIRDQYGNYQFINLENTADGHPCHDIVSLYQACLYERLWDPIQTYPWIKSYREHAALFHPEDEWLLKSRLLEETGIYSFIELAPGRIRGEEHIWTLELEKYIWFMEKVHAEITSWPSRNDEENQRE
ncbi:hypothetical protein [Bacillus piscicola]|uniref:hypothetical protein n=1 Tax=Bacillus piscicola TaxID=1632684 RepID=UPI001F089B46|nr:hypothetical protein [Bacillus piscicola]